MIRIPAEAADDLTTLTVEIAATIDSSGSVDGNAVLWSGVNDTDLNELTTWAEEPDWYFNVSLANTAKLTTLPFPLDSWSHVAVDRNESGTSRIFRHYTPDAAQTFPADPLDISENGLVLGALQGCVGGCFSVFGAQAVDSFRIMNRVLSADELLHYPLSGWSAASVNLQTSCIPDPRENGATCNDHIDCLSANCQSGACAP